MRPNSEEMGALSEEEEGFVFGLNQEFSKKVESFLKPQK
jgi:hypothetical protein